METVKRDYGSQLIDGAHTTDSLKIVGDWFGRTVKTAAAELGKKPLCTLAFNQQASGRDATLLIDTLEQTFSRNGVSSLHRQYFAQTSRIRTKDTLGKPSITIISQSNECAD